MANFKMALEALSKGNINIDALTGQLAKILDKTPQKVLRMLSDLDNIYQKKLISDADYIKLKNQINQYRRTHPNATESGQNSSGDATVFDQSDQIAEGPEDATVVSESLQQGDADATEVIPQQGDADATEVIPQQGDADATEVMPQQQDGTGFDVTGETDMIGVEVDFSNTEGPSTASVAGTGWSDPSTSSQGAAPLGPGSIIKQRFELHEVLGIGGMGKVYRGLDLLKQEARDKKPYVAIKLLNEDFKDHPEAFISLQRESSRQQKLAHPNIATIYDFDRVGGPGTPVFITMELMEGMELKDYIRKKIKLIGGLPFEEAFTIIQQLVSGLAYAHERRLVHSDFKPGNCFLCNDGTVKTLDFGIARAVKNPVTGEAEKTLFDPGQLGALTPAYASYEMLEGEEPDTRDDIYALGCVSYELLTGRHPFDKVPANKAKDNNLKPFIVKGLKKKQNRALQRAVAFKRKDRSPTVEHFIEELEARYIWYKSPLTIAAILFIAIGLGGTAPVLNYYQQQKVEQFITEINTGTPQIIAEHLSSINTFKKAEQRVITDDAKTTIQTYLSNQITRAIDITADNYNFLKAEIILTEIGGLYPDSSFLEEQQALIIANKKQQLSKLNSQFSDALITAKEQNDESLLDDAKNILEVIKKRIDPEDPLLSDLRTSNQYRLLANNSFELGDHEKALKLISSGISLAPQDKQLADTKAKIEKAVNIERLEDKLTEARAQLVALADHQAIKDDIIALAELDPDNGSLVPIARSLRELTDEKLENITNNGQQADAKSFVDEYGPLLSILQINAELIAMKLAHLSGAERIQKIQQLVADDISIIQQSLGAPQMDNFAWEAKMLSALQELDSLAKAEPLEAAKFTNDLEDLRGSIVALYIDEAEKILEVRRFDAARDMANRGTRFSPEGENVLATLDTITEAETAHEKQLLIDGLIKDFRAQISANQITKALEYYNEIKIGLPEEHAFIAQEAPISLSTSYANLASNSFEASDFTSALRFADEGLKLNPENAVLKNARTEYAAEANIIDLTAQFANETSFDIGSIQTKIGEISNSVKSNEFRQNAIKQLAERINELKTSNENLAAKLAEYAATFFPGSALTELKNELRLKPWPDAPTAVATLNSGKLTEATNMLKAANADFPEHPEVDSFSKALVDSTQKAIATFNEYLARKEGAGTDYNQLRVAKKLLLRAQSLWIDNTNYDTEETELNELIDANKPAAKKVLKRENVDLADSQTSSGATAKEWKPVDSGRTCENRLAGYGKRARAICYDFVNSGWRGPLMVVVPKGESFDNPFAISKYEISVGDYGKYCAISKACTPERNKDKLHDPISGISLAEAEAYAKWVTERTGKTYRLPTTSEWVYATSANGKQPKKDYNCRVALGDKIVKGTGVTSVKSGQSNGWGMKNYVGNVQEWVVDGDKISARGGAFEDAHSKCDISFNRKHDGQSDKTTGFRLVLEEVS